MIIDKFQKIVSKDIIVMCVCLPNPRPPEEDQTPKLGLFGLGHCLVLMLFGLIISVTEVPSEISYNLHSIDWEV